MKLFKKAKKGFTLVELVVVIAVIAILAAVSTITYVNITDRARHGNDVSFLGTLNSGLAASESYNGKKPSTMHEALEDLEEIIGISDPAKFLSAQSKDLEFAYDLANNRFVLLEGNEVVEHDSTITYAKGEIEAKDRYKYWKMVSEFTDLSDFNYSVYFAKNAHLTDFTINAGVDFGYNTFSGTVTYKNTSGNEKDVVIRTASASTTLSVDAAADTIHHYNLVGEVNIIKTADGSYHEYGTAGFVKVASGRVVAENSGSIETVLLTEKGEGATLPAVLQIKQGGSVNNKYATSTDVASANNGAANDPYQLNPLLPSSEGGNILVADEGKTIAETIERIKIEAVSEVTPDPYAKIVADGLELGANYAVLKEDKTLYGYELPAVFSDQHYTILMIQNYTTDDFFAVVNNSTITLDLNGNDFEITDPEGIGVFGTSNLILDVIDNKGTGSITLKSICLLGSTNTITFNDVNFVFNHEEEAGGFSAFQGKVYFDGGNYTFNGCSSFEDCQGALQISSDSLVIKECKINIDPADYVDGNVYNVTLNSGIYTVSAK